MQISTSEAERLARTYSNTILRIAYTYLRSTADAEDLCQEVLLKSLMRNKPFDSPEHERAWIVRVAINACKDALRRQSARPTEALDDMAEPVDPTTEAANVDRDRAETVLAAVQSLPILYREAIYLHYYEGYSARELAKIAGCSETAALKRLSQARKLLRKSLEGGSDGIRG